MPQAPARRAASESSDVANLVRLHHRRRGWAWVAVGSAIGLAVFVGIDVNLFQNLTGSAETLSVIPVFVLLALVLAGRHRAAFGCRRDDPPLTGACLYAKSQVSPALQ